MLTGMLSRGALASVELSWVEIMFYAFYLADQGRTSSQSLR